MPKLPGNRANPDGFFRDLERQAVRYRLRTVRITGECDTLVGLCLFDRGLADSDLEAMVSGFATLAARPATADDQLVVARLPKATGAVHDDTVPAPPLHPAQETVLLDQVTGLPNGAYFLRLLATELERVRNTRLPCALLVVEIDDLAATARAYGPELGDEATRQLAAFVQTHLHRSDLLGRHAAARFAILLPGSNMAKAVQRAEALRRAARSQPVLLGDEPVPHTFSIGVAMANGNERLTAAGFLAQATAELGRARAEGGDRVCRPLLASPGDDCQVTVEERTQLFGFLRKQAES